MGLLTLLALLLALLLAAPVGVVTPPPLFPPDELQPAAAMSAAAVTAIVFFWLRIMMERYTDRSVQPTQRGILDQIRQPLPPGDNAVMNDGGGG
ncbi:MAG TPA: hypothetical protein VHZ96_18235 [Frankiaceae bacterium]|jgi:hypothetical protein|nr:hypothetical protein [Frankiaceae bacterium]